MNIQQLIRSRSWLRGGRLARWLLLGVTVTLFPSVGRGQCVNWVYNPYIRTFDCANDGAGGVAGVASFNGRTGAVTPGASDYTKSDVGLGNVENTALSTWAGSGNITTVGTLGSGSVPWARLTGVTAANPVFNTIVGQPATDVAAVVARCVAGSAEACVQGQNKANNAELWKIDATGLATGVSVLDAGVPAGIARDSEVTAAIAALSSVYQPLATGTPDGTKFLRDDNTWQSVAAGSLDINGLASEASPVLGDSLPIYDLSATGNKKITIQALLGLLGLSAGEGVAISGDVGSGYEVALGPDALLKSELQSGQSLRCVGSASATAQTCSLLNGSEGQVLVGYTEGMVAVWESGATNSSGAITVDIDGQGAKSIKKIDGTTDPDANSLASGRPYVLWYDGTVFRVLAGLEAEAVAISGERFNPYQDFAVGLTFANATAGPANRVVMYRFVPKVTHTVSAVVGRVTSGSAGSMGCAIYTSLTAKALECPKLSTTSTAGVSGSLTAGITLQAGTPYYFAASIDNATAQTSTVSVQGIYYVTQSEDMGYCTETADFTQAAGSIFPATCTWNNQSGAQLAPMFILE